MNIKNILHFSPGGKLTAAVMSVMGIFAPIRAMIIVLTVFIVVDFVLGLTASLKVRKEPFSTQKAYWSVWKLIGAMVCILLA